MSKVVDLTGQPVAGGGEEKICISLTDLAFGTLAEIAVDRFANREHRINAACAILDFLSQGK